MKTGFIGGGTMAEAMIASLIESRVVGAHQVFASDVSAERRSHLKKRYGINVYSKNSIVPGMARIVFLAVKPQHLDAVLKEIRPAVSGKHLVISIAAGKKIGSVQSGLPGSRVIRVMPNLPSVVAAGMSVFCAGSSATGADRRTATKLLSCFGEVLELPEETLDAVTALSGSGPAFFSYLLDCMVSAAVSEGLDREAAVLLAEQTMLGTSKLLKEKDIEPRELVKAVASPQGTTAAGLAVLRKSAFRKTVRRMIRAAARRSRELSR